MATELTPQQKFHAESAEAMVPKALLKGRSHASIVEELIQLDWTPKAAQALVDRVANDIQRYQTSPQSRAALIRECRQEFITGLIATCLGLLVTAGSFLLMITGVLYVWIIATGIILFGLIRMGRGWSRWRLYGRGSQPFSPELQK